jgi:tRNA pseudouridine55 synthase
MPVTEKLNGWLIIDKPLGISSAHVVAKIKRLTKAKVGHAGTLDPLATGVLPIALNEATKVTQFMIDSDKEYEFEVTWGQERDTDDGEGQVVASSELQVAREDVLKAMEKFRGEIEQVPPQYSAIKVGGKRAYDTARKGGETELKARKVNIRSLKLESCNSEQTKFHLACSKGTYVRSLARDMGRVIGCFGYVSALRRIRHGVFDISQAITLEKLEEMCKTGALAQVLLPVQKVLDGIPALSLSEEEESKIRNGIALPREVQNDLVALFRDNTLVALASPQNGKLQPVRVFNI